MKGRHVRAAAFLVTAGAALLATDTSASGTELLCLSGQGQFIVCPADTVPISSYPLQPPTTGSPSVSTGPASEPAGPGDAATSPADTLATRAPDPTRATENPKRGGGVRHLVPVALGLLILVAISGTLVYWLGTRRRSRTRRERGADPFSLTNSAIGC